MEAAVAQRADDTLEDLYGAVEHLQAGLAGAARAPRREDDEVRVLAVAVVTHAYDEVVAKTRGEVVEVARLRGGGLRVDIQEYDLVNQVLEHKAQRRVAAHASRANDHCLASLDLSAHIATFQKHSGTFLRRPTNKKDGRPSRGHPPS